MRDPGSLSADKKALLEARLKGASKAQADRLRIPRRPAAGAAPLSFSQRQTWLIDRMMPGNPAYNLPNGFRLEGRLDVKALEESLDAIVARHEILRTTYTSQDGEPAQLIHPECRIALIVVDLEPLPELEREVRLQELATAEALRPFDLARLPLIRATLFRLAEAEHVLLVNIHHIAVDGLSIAILLNELDAFYGALSRGAVHSAPPLAVQYADFSDWQRRTVDAKATTARIQYWRNALADAPPALELPADLPRPAVQSFKGSNVFFEISDAQAQALRSLGAEHGCTVFMTMLAAFEVLLMRHSGAEDLTIGTPIGARTNPDVEPLIGNFLNVVALRGDLSGDPTFAELLGRTRDRTLAAFSHGELPFEALVRELRIERDPSRNPVFQVMLQMVSMGPRKIGGLDCDNFHFDLGFAQFDLTLHLYEEAGGYAGRFEYCTDLFRPETIRRLAGHFGELLRALAEDPRRRISALPILTDAEQALVTETWNDSAKEFGAPLPVHQLVAKTAERFPGRVALEFEGRKLSYADLRQRASGIASALRARGAGRGQRIGLCVERGTDMLAALLGILETGAAYVPLDPSFPRERLRFMADDAELAQLVSTSTLAHEFDLPRERQWLLDVDAPSLAEPKQEELSPDSAADARTEDPAYVIYTSGSTGKPKGVVVPHRAVANFLAGMAIEPGLGAEDVLVAVTTLSFDIAVLELLLPLAVGARVVIASRDDAIDGRALAALLERSEATVMQATPATWRLLLAAGWTPRGRFKALVGGEALPPDLADALIERGVELWNMYGPTETTVWSTCARITDPSLGITIGHPIANTRVYILDAAANPCPIGVPGELCIGGAGVSLGYWKRPELTAERFVVDSFSSEPGARLYRTGDRARWRADGTLEHLGRLDFQLKLRGYRIELGEIEAALASHAAVGEAVVVAREDAPGDKRLVAYVVAKQGRAGPAEELRTHLRRTLPDYMVPAHFVSMEALPRTANGKLDRKALPPPEGPATIASASLALPRTETERAIAAIWSEVLRIESVGIEQNFFELGGHSLMAMQVASRLRQSFLLELPVRDLFAAPTIARLAARIEALRSPSKPASGEEDREPSAKASIAAEMQPIPRATRSGPLPLSFSQRRMWLVQHLNPATTAYNVTLPLRVRGPLDPRRFERALQAVVRRHEGFRTRFEVIGGEAMQLIDDFRPAALSITDLRSLPRDRRDAEARRLLAEMETGVFDLATSGLHRVALIRIDEAEHVLIWILHHAIVDFWSLGVLIRELGQAYAESTPDREAQLPPLSLDYADFSAWQRDASQAAAIEPQMAFWRNRLAGVPPVVVQGDLPAKGLARGRGSSISAYIPAATLEALKRLSDRLGATPFMTLLACFKLLLARHTGQSDIAVGSPIANRLRPDIENLVGTFVNTLVLRTDLSGNPTFSDLLSRVKETALEAFANQDAPFERLVYELEVDRTSARSPLVQVMFNVENARFDTDALPGLTLAPFEFDSMSSQFDLLLSIDLVMFGEARLFYDTDVFVRSTAERMLASFLGLLEQVIADPAREVGEYRYLGSAETAELATWNATGRGYERDLRVHELIAASLGRDRERPAIAMGANRVSRGGLADRANRIARELRARGVGRGALVGLYLERSPETVASQLAILQAGAAYVPLDPAYPVDRLEYMATDACLALLLTDSTLAQNLRWPREHSLWLDHDAAAIAARAPAPLDADASLDARPEDPAYVIYTSGSTGKPKGVMVPHRAVVNFLESMAREPGMSASDRIVAVTTLSFDIAVLELLLPLAVGAEIVLATRDEALDGRALAELIASSGATLMQATPSTWRMLIESGWAGGRRFKALVGGEGLPPDLAQKLLERTGETWNMYGPTETTVWSTCWKVERPEEGISIGRPVANTQVHILDERGRPSPIGAPGEILIGGDGVTLGYLGRPELTAERFVPDRFRAESGAKLYRTGDRGRWRHDGRLEHLGRLDFQVKVRGYRIELGEIEAALASFEGISQTVVIAREDEPGDVRLVAYFVAIGAEPSGAALREYLRRTLPAYMVPSHFVALKAIPLLPNGKIDRRALPRPSAEGEAAVHSAQAEPHTDTEKRVAGVWREVLKLSFVGRDDNFFDIGGHSLLAMQAIFLIEAKLGKRVTPTRFIFESLAQIARAYDEMESESRRKPGLLARIAATLLGRTKPEARD